MRWLEKVWLKIWSKIKDLFGERKMEIDKTINKWFEETASYINSEIETDTSVDNLLSSVIPLSHNYCNAVLLLANNEHRLPAMALLRVLAELALRVIWCLYGDNPLKEPVDLRIDRWIKQTFIENKKLLKKVLPSASAEKAKDIQREIDFLHERISAIPHRPVGPFYNSLDELPTDYKNKIYPLLYGAFNRAIHPDLRLLADLVRQDRNQRVFSSDLTEVDIQALKIYCMTATFNILSVVRLHYHWDYKGMKSEYLAIKKKILAKEQGNQMIINRDMQKDIELSRKIAKDFAKTDRVLNADFND